MRDLDWGARRGPLADLPNNRPSDRRGGDFGGERRREFQNNDDGKVRDFGNWERRGPLSPLAQPERPESREGSRTRAAEPRADSFRKTSPAAWGPGEGRQEGSHPPRREFTERPERPERVPTAAEKDFNWRNNMRADAPVKSPVESREPSAPSSPAPAAALPAGRPKLNLAKRTVSEAVDAAAPATSDSKASPFGAARPIDTAAREREIEERRLKDKEEAEEKAKQEKIAKEAAEKEAAAKAAEEEAKAKEAAANAEKEAPAAEEAKEATEESPANEASAEQKAPARPREPREPAKPSRAVESGNWRSASAEQRAPSRGSHAPGGPRRGAPRGPRDTARPPRANGSGPASEQPQSPTTEEAPPTPKVDSDGWTTVAAPTKGRRGQSNRP